MSTQTLEFTARQVRESVKVSGMYAAMRQRRAKWEPLLPEFLSLVRSGTPVRHACIQLGLPANVGRDWAAVHIQANRVEIPAELAGMYRDIRLLPRKYQLEIVELWNGGERDKEVLDAAWRRAWKGEFLR